MADTINIAAIAMDIVWGNPEANLIAAERLIDKLPENTDIIVVPELFTTGFIQDETVLDELSSSVYTDLTLQKVKAWARKSDSAVCGSFSTDENGYIYNRAFFITPEGKSYFYDKRHLFLLSAENRIYTPGKEEIPVFSFRGWNISMMVCYDLRFPVWSRNRHHKYDMMIVPANWPTARGYAWEHLLIARAIENQAVYIGCDRGGHDDYGEYDGLIKILDANGRPIQHVFNGTEGKPVIVIASPSLTDLQKARRRLPVIESADDFQLIIN